MSSNEEHENESKRTAEDVYWEYVEKAGEEACAEAVINYFDRDWVVEILLERIDPDDLEEFLRDNVVTHARHEAPPRIARKLTDEEFFAELDAMADSPENRPQPSESQYDGETHDWREQGF